MLKVRSGIVISGVAHNTSWELATKGFHHGSWEPRRQNMAIIDVPFESIDNNDNEYVMVFGVIASRSDDWTVRATEIDINASDAMMHT